jgi:hypothetical protein
MALLVVGRPTTLRMAILVLTAAGRDKGASLTLLDGVDGERAPTRGAR